MQPLLLLFLFTVGLGVAANDAVVSSGSPVAWKSLKTTAKTPSEFQALALHCDRMASVVHQKIENCRQELARLKSNPNLASTKWPYREDSLDQLISRYSQDEQKWATLARQFRNRANVVAQ
jgi:hypothetical protein